MTRKEIEKAKKSLFVNGIYSLTEDEQKIANELSCREMINSILCYHGERGLFTENGDLNRYLYRKGSDHEYYGIGKERIMELIDEQLNDFRQAKVLHSVYTDGEGLTYNSIVWADDK